MAKPPVCLSVAGLDPSGGAGILADARVFAAYGCFPAAAVTSITFQNTQEVRGAVSQSPETVIGQMDPVFDDYKVNSVKTGMLPDSGVIEAVAGRLRTRESGFLVVDPVVRSTSGFDLIDDNALASLIKELFPIADIVTPNIAETERISGVKIAGREDIEEAATKIRGLGATNVLIKGGHIPLATSDLPFDKAAIDFLFLGDRSIEFSTEYLETSSTHGTGCVLSSAIAACLAKGLNLEEAVRDAKSFVHNGIKSSPGVGKGNSPISIESRFSRRF
ncbi:MAG: bifunctional hydroxymethylpyrimidine kinase/phosphomethylpyrimidine kinase [Acidobacteria bacterium]|nr:MAG: bifunctional hydroxymethylpyrimidine kinase/phosphomethylpyrimidine kinase [Acidobacteriota bacterium]REK01935.1 MAG: bifunctional hydroxymethylpyrimidine kinase/phosphomethylpyrimidine kinase [Acidobacteriota bacterium]REK14891.1 MAG: bifunctional hydroxymethylpyrimidine kinase/phosphomethylpyrimidine kinase [Acidobacteriota bacterium]REK45606.1 MAG: bifunctional hydroxymethylpyrimidine kinase/phosphomethylpyrimidine kinase [Acidobacteriota bacterium]